jgi:hypothetical protein
VLNGAQVLPFLHESVSDRAGDAPDTDRTMLRHVDFGHLRQQGREGELDGRRHSRPIEAMAASYKYR